MDNEITGHLILIMAPSGSGKGMLLKHLRDTLGEKIYFAVSCTTRDPRPDEVIGEVYQFVSQDEFEQKVAEGAFLEWAEFSGHHYGTLKDEILTPLKKGRVVVREVELQGILALREIIPAEHRTIIYIEAGSWEVLKRRIRKRAPISEEHLELRHQRYQEESKWKEFADVIIENNEGRLDEAKKEIEKLVEDRIK